MGAEKTHWKSMQDRDYLGNFDLPDGRDVVAKIVRVEKKKVRSKKKADGEHKPCVYFEGKEKGLLCNATNGNTIANMYGPFVEDWVGKYIALYVTTTSSPDGTVPCIRIRPTSPKAARESRESAAS